MIKEIKKELIQHFLDYLLLVVAGIFTVVLLMLFRGEKSMQFALILSYAIFYVLWASYHHLINNSFKVKNMLEYILIALIVVMTLKVIIAP